jgi:4-hydroxy-3-methylbut-2-enyl diphosphate reductase
MRIVIDPQAAPCPGVQRAITIVEENLQDIDPLFALGPVIHNQDEMDRLTAKGLQTINQAGAESSEDLASLSGRRLLIRTHGIGEDLRNRLLHEKTRLIDATCPIVRRVQRLVQKYYLQGYQIVIAGKPKHPEVLGLLGHCGKQGVVVENETDLTMVDLNRKTFLAAQTTINPAGFFAIRDKLINSGCDVIAIDTTCRHIGKRHQQIERFASTVDIVLLVGGKSSSNTTVLYDVCRHANSKSYRIESFADVEREWLRPDDVIGITGSASTPLWQLAKVQEYLQEIAQLGIK